MMHFVGANVPLPGVELVTPHKDPISEEHSTSSQSSAPGVSSYLEFDSTATESIKAGTKLRW